MDIALAVQRLVPDAQYHQFDTYEHLAESWFDARQLPTLTELETAWAAIEAERAALAQSQQDNAAKQQIAKAAAKAIPNWATWDETQVLAWMDTNLSDAQVDALAIPAGAKTIIKTQNVMLRALARMVVALRDEAWPDLSK